MIEWRRRENQHTVRIIKGQLWLAGVVMLVVFFGNMMVVHAEELTPDIEKLLSQGEEHYKNYRYTSPAGSGKNAVDVYQKILQIDPGNATAQERLTQMEAYYSRKFSTAKTDADRKSYAEKILIINPASEQAMKFLEITPPPVPPTPTPEAEQPPAPILSMEEQLREERYKGYSGSIVKLLGEADAEYQKRNGEDQGPVNKAIDLFEDVLRIDPNNYDALWQAARTVLWLGDHSPEEQKIEIFSKGMDYAKKATEVNPGTIEGHYWLGSNMGKFGSARGIFKSLEYIDPIIKEMETILKIDPVQYKAITVLGILYRKAPPWPVSVGDIDKSEEYLRRAISTRPSSLHAQLELGITYNKLKKWDEAKAQFQKVIDMPFEEPYVPENKEYKEEAREILQMIKRRGL